MPIFAALLVFGSVIATANTLSWPQSTDERQQTAPSSKAEAPASKPPEGKATHTSGQEAGSQASGEEPKKDVKETQQVGKDAGALLGLLKGLGKKAGLPTTALDQSFCVVQQLTRTTRADQQSVYLFARQLNRNVDNLRPTDSFPTTGNCRLGCGEFKRDVQHLSDTLMRSSYTDDLVQNKNLSHQIKLRMPLLIADSLRLSDRVTEAEAATATAEATEAASPAQATLGDLFPDCGQLDVEPQSGKKSVPKKTPEPTASEPPTTATIASLAAASGPTIAGLAAGGTMASGTRPPGTTGLGTGASKTAASETTSGTMTMTAFGTTAFGTISGTMGSGTSSVQEVAECEAWTEAKTSGREKVKRTRAEAELSRAGAPKVTSTECAAWTRRRDFYEDLKLLSDRFTHSRRFRLGIGATYSYMPKVHYTNTTTVDLTQFRQDWNPSTGDANQSEPTPMIAATRLTYDRLFAGASYPGVVVSTKIPYVRLDASFANFSQTRTFSTPVRSYLIDPSTEVLKRDTVTSKLRFVGDVSIKIPLADLIRTWNTRVDVGLGAGISGFHVNDSISSEVKAQIDGMNFNNIQPGTIINSSNDNSFRAYHVNAELSFKISDEFHTVLEAKYFPKRDADMGITVSGATFSISAVWFPTLF